MNRTSYLLIASIATSLPSVPFLMFSNDLSPFSAGHWLVVGVVVMPCLWLLGTANAQRLHDLDMSGWLQLVFIANFAITFAILAIMPILFRAELLWPLLALNILALPVAAWAVWLMVEMFCSGGSKSANRFGPPRSLHDLFDVPSVSHHAPLPQA